MKTKTVTTGIFAGGVLGEIEFSLSGPIATPKEKYYASSVGVHGQAIAKRSNVHPWYDYSKIPRKFASRQTFVATEWQSPLGGAYGPLPINFQHDNGSGLSSASIHFDELVAFGPFTKGIFKMVGYNGQTFANSWAVMLEAENSEFTNITVPSGSFVVFGEMTAQAIIDINGGGYPSIPGAVVAQTNSLSLVTDLRFYLS